MALMIRLIVIYIYAWNIGLHFEFAEIAENIVLGHGYSWNWDGMVPLQPTAAFPRPKWSANRSWQSPFFWRYISI